MSSFRDLPPTRDLPLQKPTDLESAQAELLAMRIMLATLIWKAGGSVLVTPADVEFAAKRCSLHATPSVKAKDATLWHVKEGTFAAPKIGNS